MPLNLNTSFKRRVLRKRSEKCTWKTHFDGCAREVAGALELLANNRPDRFVFARVEPIKAICDKKGKRKYSLRMIEDVLRLFRELKILGEHMEIEIAEDVWRKGRFFNPHEMMTRRYDGCCVFIGGGKKPGTWSIDGIWQPGDGGEFPGVVVEDTTPNTTPITRPVVAGIVDGIVHPIVAGIVDAVVDPIVDDQPRNCGDGRGDENGDLLGLEEDTDEQPSESSHYSASEPLKPVEPSKPSKPDEPPQPRNLIRREPREWLSWMWNEADLSRDYDDRLGSLRYRRAPSLRLPSPQMNPPGRADESPDVTAIEELIAIHKEIFVKLAWAAFAFQFKHDKDTKFPITVFTTPENFAGMLQLAKHDLREWNQNQRKGKPPWTIDCALAFDNRER